MKKSKLFKTISFSSLALLMGAAGVFAFAPLGASPSVAKASEMVDQVNTKADGENIKYAPSALGLDPENDPVIYTTESGLEIKYGGESVTDQLASGKPLTGYPYFTMGTYNGYAVNWVIIGRNTNDTVFTDAISAHLFSTWKTNNSASSATYENKGYYFFNNTYESTTPAGSAINGVVPSKSYVADVTKATKTVVGNDEVPQGCVLAISECCLGYSWFNSTSGVSQVNTLPDNPSSSCNGSRYRYRSDNIGCSSTFVFKYDSKIDGTLYSNMNSLFNSTLGLSTTQKNLIIGQKLDTIYDNGTTYYMETYNTDGSSLYEFFPLAGWKFRNGSNSTLGVESFEITTYLTSNALRVAYQIGTSTTNYWYLRTCDANNPYGVMSVQPGGASQTVRVTLNLGVRPAGVFKLG